MATLVQHYLAATANRTPGATALVTRDRTVTFEELAVESDRFAVALRRRGVVRGDRVCLFLENSWEMVVALLGIQKAGAAWLPVDPSTKGEKLRYLLRDSESSALVADGGRPETALGAVRESPSVRSVWWVGGVPEDAGSGGRDLAFDVALADSSGPPPDPRLIDRDLAGIIYTSGSTGDPKGVMLDHANVVNTARAISTYLGNVPDDVVICGLPLSFDYGLFQVLTALRVGFSVVLRRSFAFPWQFLEDMEEHGVTGLPGVPTVFASLLRFAPFEGLDLTSLRYLTNTAANFPPAHIRRLRDLLPGTRIYSMYGLTECTRVSYLDPDELDDHVGSVGKAMPNCEVWVAGEDGREVPPGVVGELMVRGANIMRGYWHKPEATARRLTEGGLPGEKILRTGDLFRMDADGFLTFVGRKDDVFKCQGQKVSPREVENVLHGLEGVGEVAVVGVPHPMDGEAVKAFIVREEWSDLSEREVRRHCRAHLQDHLVPRHLEFCDALPRTRTGKVATRSLSA